MGYNSKGNSNKQDLIQDELGSEISITLLTLRSSRIFSINKLMIIAKRENHTHRTYNKQKG